MDFAIPEEIQQTLRDLDDFIEREIRPLQAQDDNERFFDHRREWARTDFENDGVPRADWEELLREMRRRADVAGWLRLALPSEFGGGVPAILRWRLFVNTWRPRVLAYSTIYKMNLQSWATFQRC